MKIPEISREELFNLSTTELYRLSGVLTELHKKIEGELLARGDL